VNRQEGPIGAMLVLQIGANSPVIIATVAVISSAKALAYPSLQRTSHVTSLTNRLSIIAATGFCPLLAVTSLLNAESHEDSITSLASLYETSSTSASSFRIPARRKPAKARNPIDQRPATAVEIREERGPVPWRKMPGGEHLAIIRQEAQLFDPAYADFGRTTGETPIREITIRR
jgi:hypothetical protein